MEKPSGFSRLSFRRKSSKKLNKNKGEQHWRKVLQAKGQAGKRRACFQEVNENGETSGAEEEETKNLVEPCSAPPDVTETPVTNSHASSSTFFKRMSAWLNSRRKITSRSLKRKVDKRPHLGHMRLRRAKGFDFSHLPEESNDCVVGRSYVRVQESNGLVANGANHRSQPSIEAPNMRSHLFNHNRIVVTESDDPNYVFIHNKKSETISDRRENDSNSPARSRSTFYDQKKKRNMFLAVPMDTRYAPIPESRERTPEEKRLPLTATASCPARSPTASESDLTIDVIKRSWSWPFQKQRMDERGTEDINVTDFRRSRFNSSMDKTERFEDCSIPLTDIEFGDCLRSGRNCTIYRGRWHGDVSIHHFRNLSPADSADIWNIVTRLHWVRHEHVALFMGVSMDEENMAVVFSFQDGISMHEHIHIKGEKMALQARVDLIRQVGFGMGYLHSRDIIHRKLNTRNVFLCPNVRISVMDYAITDKKYERDDYVCLCKGELAYIAPEVLSTMKIVPPSLIPCVSYTMESDVFAFGTLVYEFLSGKHPFQQHPPDAIIWLVCSRHRQPLNFRNKTRTLQMLIEKCWAHDPRSRPTFQSINKDLYKKTFLHRQHSCSESDLLMRCGGGGRGFL